MLILSEASIGSSWVEREVDSAMEEEDRRGKTILFPVRLDSAVMETRAAWAGDVRRDRLIGDFTHWKDDGTHQTAFERVLRDLQADRGRQDTERPQPDFDRAMVESGLVERVPDPADVRKPRTYRPIRIEGEPISQTIIEERR